MKSNRSVSWLCYSAPCGLVSKVQDPLSWVLVDLTKEVLEILP